MATERTNVTGTLADGLLHGGLNDWVICYQTSAQ